MEKPRHRDAAHLADSIRDLAKMHVPDEPRVSGTRRRALTQQMRRVLPKPKSGKALRRYIATAPHAVKPKRRARRKKRRQMAKASRRGNR